MDTDNLNDEKVSEQTEILKQDLPTIFELNAHDHFHSLIQPALKHIVKVLAKRGSDRSRLLEGYSDEVACLSHLAVEALFLHFNGSSFSEFFYELKRLKIHENKRFLKSSFVMPYLVFFPYLKSKIDTIYLDKIQEMNSSNNEPCLLYFLKMYPQFNAIYEAVTLIFQLSYALGKSTYYSPLLRIMSMVLVRNPNSEDEPVFDNSSIKIWRKLNLKSLMANVALMLVGCLQFVEWWQREDRPAIELFPTHIPPSPPALESNDEHIFTLCPLCGMKRLHDTVVISSGYVFCKECIETYVRNNNRCPVTGFPSTIHTLVPLYVQ